MRILHLADRLTDRGGAYRYLSNVIALQSRVHDVHLGVGSIAGDVAPPCETSIVAGLDARERTPIPIEDLVECVDPNVVHAHTVVNAEALERVSALRGIAKVATVQDHRYFCPARGKWTADGAVCRDTLERDVCTGCFTDEGYFREVYDLTSERLSALSGFRVTVLSHYMKRELVAAGVPESRVRVVPPFAHGLDRRARADGPPCILYVGRLVESKGVREAFQAWRLSRVPLPLVVAGTGPLRQLVESSGAEVLGWVPHERMSALYRRASALLMPSRWQEPFGIAGLEALTMGVPVVAWRSGGIEEWHPGPGLVEWGDIEALASELRVAIERRVEPPPGFEPDAMMERLDSVYRSIHHLRDV